MIYDHEMQCLRIKNFYQLCNSVSIQVQKYLENLGTSKEIFISFNVAGIAAGYHIGEIQANDHLP